jgi:hypothetical protein
MSERSEDGAKRSAYHLEEVRVVTVGPRAKPGSTMRATLTLQRQSQSNSSGRLLAFAVGSCFLCLGSSEERSMAKAYRKNGTRVAKPRSVATQRGADDDSIFILSKPVRYPKRKTGCSDVPLLVFHSNPVLAGERDALQRGEHQIEGLDQRDDAYEVRRRALTKASLAQAYASELTERDCSPSRCRSG